MPRARRISFHLAWILPVVLVIWGGVVVWGRVQAAFDCPSGIHTVDPRAYPAQQEEDCGWTNEATSTYEGMLRYYSVAVPPAATGVRYLSSISFNGPDELFLRFSASQPEIDQTLAAFHAVPDGHSVADELFNGGSLIDEFHLDDWKFTGPPSDYVTYTFGAQPYTPLEAVGWVIVDRSTPVPTAFVFSSV
jgi:hypothetical protein